MASNLSESPPLSVDQVRAVFAPSDNVLLNAERRRSALRRAIACERLERRRIAMERFEALEARHSGK